MEPRKYTREQILVMAEHAQHYTDLLIKQCDRWLSAEEGLKNAEQQIRERKEKELANQKAVKRKTGLFFGWWKRAGTN